MEREAMLQPTHHHTSRDQMLVVVNEMKTQEVNINYMTNYEEME